MSGTAATVTALNGHLDDLDAARAAFASDVTPHLGGLQAEARRPGRAGSRTRSSLVVDALAPSPTLGFLEPLSKAVLDDASANPVNEFQEWLGTFMAWFQDIVAGLDLSAIKEPLQTAADTAHEALDAFDQAIAGVTVAVKGLFADVEGLVDQVDLSGLVTELENTLHDFTTQLETQLASLFSPVRDAVHDAVTSLDGVVDEFDPAQIVDVLNDLMSSLEGILDGAADAAKEIGDTLQEAADAVQNVSFAPITDEVIHEIDAVTDSLEERSTPRSSRRRSSSRSRPRSPSSPRTSTRSSTRSSTTSTRPSSRAPCPALDAAARRAAEAARPGEAVRADDADRRRALDALPAAPPGDERVQAERAARPREAAARRSSRTGSRRTSTRRRRSRRSSRRSTS